MNDKISRVVEYRHQFQVLDPPPPDLTSNFETLHEWLFSICDYEQPEKSIATYDFGLFESQDDYIICLVGENTYKKSKNYSVTNIDYKPRHTYFRLPKSEYGNLTRQQVLERLTSQ